MTASRVGYYEGVGALRDMLQNHMLQVLCVAAMEPPFSLDAEVVRDAKAQVLHCLRPMTTDDVRKNVVRGQYIEGDEYGQRVPSYRHEVRKFFEERSRKTSPPKPIPSESVNSTTETFVAMQVFIDNWRWAGVPFYLRTGKRLPKRASEISVHMKEVPPILFNANPSPRLDPNVLSVRIQPDEGFSLGISSKLPGPHVRVYPVKMDFHYGSTFG